MLQLADRVKFYNFNKRSVQDELFTEYIKKYTPGCIMTLGQFFDFLEDHMIEKPGSDEKSSMFDEIEQIHQLYLDLKLDKATCLPCIKPLSCLRRWNDEKSRLKRVLGPDTTSKKVSTVKIVTNMNKLYSQIKAQANFLAKCFVTNSI